MPLLKKSDCEVLSVIRIVVANGQVRAKIQATTRLSYLSHGGAGTYHAVKMFDFNMLAGESVVRSAHPRQSTGTRPRRVESFEE